MNSKIILAKKIRMDREYTNVLSYSESDMVSLCRSQDCFIAEASNYSFIRPTGTIMVGFTYSQCLQANYIAFQNPDYSNKWFFAWIDSVVYKGDKNTEIYFTVDAWSTWYDYWQKKTCFINRQHVNDDTIGLHTIPENLDVGEVIEEALTEDASYGNDITYWVAIASNWKIKDGSDSTSSDKGSQFNGITVINKIVYGTQIFLIEIAQLSSFSNLLKFILRTNADGHIEDIQNIFIVPDVAIDRNNLTSHTASISSNSFTFYTIDVNDDITRFNTTINKITSFSDYQPKNNKCFVYPYNYLFVSNNNGSNNIYKYEDFSTSNCVFENQFALSVGGSGRIVPKNYKNMATNDDESLALGKYPTCAWSSDAFTNWLTQNGVNMVAGIGLTIGGVVSAIATGGATLPIVAGAITSVAGVTANTIGSFYKESLAPNISGGQATGDVIWGADRNCFSFRQMRVKTEYMKIIDDYFTRYGYAIKSLELPNLTGRLYWNYVEIGSSEEIGYGDVPSKYMESINNACRRGVTIWHTHSNIGNYSLNNSII